MKIEVGGSRPSYVLGSAEPQVQAFMVENVRAGDVVYDLGANVGYFTLLAARLVGRAGCVRAYEPSGGNVRLLRRNIALNGIDERVCVIEAAVSDADGVATFDPSSDDQSGRLGDGPLSVRTVSLDGEVARGAPPPSFVKMDVEGAELSALRGMHATLRAHRPLVLCEVHSPPDLQGEIPALLRNLGYAVRWLEGDIDGTGFWAPHLVAVPR